MKMRMMMAAFALAIAGLATPALADPDYPKLTGRVVDNADELTPADEAKLTAELADFERRTGHQFVVVTVPDLGGYDKADYAIGLGRKWGIGRKGVDDGLLMLRSPGDGKPGSGKTFIATGYGQEPYLTDAQTGEVYQNVMRPILLGKTGTATDQLPKKQRNGMAIMAGAEELMRIGSITPEQRAEDERRLAQERARQWQSTKDGIATFFTWVFGLIMAAAAGLGIWWKATAKKRAAAKAAEEARLAEIERERAAERQRQAEEDARLAEEARQRRIAADAARAAMLAALTPAARKAFLDNERREAEAAEERRQQEEARQAEARRLRRIEEEREAEEQRQRDAEESARRRRDDDSSGGFGGGGFGGGFGGSDSGDSFSGGGGSFGGGGAGGDD